ncbi:MAG TPA: response regulator, partial [Sphingobacteriaceae bacterium]
CTAMHWLSKRNIPDLIICDAQLPDMKDWELIEELSSSILYRNIPLMVITSLDRSITKVKCEEYGIMEHFIKPFNPLSILESINKLLGKKTWGRYATSLS